MTIQLGLIRACLQAGCRVRLLETGAVLEPCLDYRPAGAARLRFGQLVAVELTSPPAIVWSWQRALALTWQEVEVLALLPEGRLVKCRREAVRDHVPEVWVTKSSEGWEAQDEVLASGSPAHPDRLVNWWIGQAAGAELRTVPA